VLIGETGLYKVRDCLREMFHLVFFRSQFEMKLIYCFSMRARQLREGLVQK
jgi:hypothetical protein